MYLDDAEIIDAIDLFFRDPREKLIPPGDFGTLYLLRRDALRCLGCDPSQVSGDLSDAIQEHASLVDGVLFPGIMVLMCGIDLLGKFHAGNEKVGKVGTRFKAFSTKYFPDCSREDAHILYLFRNSMIHSFGLWMKEKQSRRIADEESSTKIYRFEIRFCGGQLITPVSGDEDFTEDGNTFAVDIHTLHRCFEQAVTKYENDVRSNENTCSEFWSMFGNYGKLFFSGDILHTEASDGPYSFSPLHRF